MTAVKENLLTLVPEMPVLIPNLTEEGAKQIYNIFITVKPEQTDVDREARAIKRLEAIESEKYLRASGRSREEIDAEIKELRSDRF